MADQQKEQQRKDGRRVWLMQCMGCGQLWTVRIKDSEATSCPGGCFTAYGGLLLIEPEGSVGKRG